MTTLTAHPSIPVTELSVPPPKRPEVEFIYNYFQPDESVDGTGAAANAIIGNQTPTAIPTSDQVKIPRFVRVALDYQSQVLPLDPEGSSRISNITTPAERSHGLENLTTTEMNLQRAFEFVPINFQDLNVAEKLYNLVKTSAERRILLENTRIKKEINVEQEEFARKSFESQSDLARILRRQVDVEDDFLLETPNNIEQLNQNLIDPDEKKRITRKNFEEVKNSNFGLRANAKFLSSLVKSAVSDPIGSYSEELAHFKESAQTFQDEAILGFRAPNSIEEGHELQIPNFLQIEGFGRSRDLRQLEGLDFQHVGYIVEKKQIHDDGVVESKKLFVITNPEEKVIIDTEVAYGARYSYQASALYVVQLYDNIELDMFIFRQEGVHEVTFDKKRFLLTSLKAPANFITCHEFVPPSPPQGLDINWMSENQAPLITWQHPKDSQRDVKRFQVLRRESLDEPFELLVEYDFDDSQVRYKSLEEISKDISIKRKTPVYHFIDTDFRTDKEYIYTLRSVDAHGLISNYGTQLSAKYNLFKNQIDVMLVGKTGAPIQYPNYTVSGKRFSQTIKDSNHRKMKIYFDPEYLNLVEAYQDRRGQYRSVNKPVFTFEGFDQNRRRKATYKLQILNVDLQQSEIVDIVINDNRQQ